MENGVKALEMAASILFAILIITALVFGYTKISEIKQVEEDNEGIEKAADFNTRFEVYNREDLYGSEVFSLANMMESYNKKEASLEKGYKKIELELTIVDPIINAHFFKKVNYKYDLDSVINNYNKLSKEIRKYDKTYFNKKVSYWSNYGIGIRLEEAVIEKVGERNFNQSQYNALVRDVSSFLDYKKEQEDIIRKSFKCVDVKYDKNTGRIIKMIYKEN